MSHYNERDTLLGQKFDTSIQVVSIGAGPGLFAVVGLRVAEQNDPRFVVRVELRHLLELIREGAIVEPGIQDVSTAGRLRSAAAIVDDARAQLDLGREKCECCNRESFRNYAHAKVHDRLTQMVERLLTMAGELSTADTTDTDEVKSR